MYYEIEGLRAYDDGGEISEFYNSMAYAYADNLINVICLEKKHFEEFKEADKMAKMISKCLKNEEKFKRLAKTFLKDHEDAVIELNVIQKYDDNNYDDYATYKVIGG